MDNSTVWQPDYNAEHFRLYFGTGKGVESLKTVLRDAVVGPLQRRRQVTDWVKVHYNEARYGRSNGFPCARQRLQQHLGAGPRRRQPVGTPTSSPPGRTDAEVDAELQAFDQWDRYDYDGDGDFNESDGYIDHFQIVHSGGDQADGDP